ncbi:hypothetical protein J7J90_04680 [Candidatus Micrarchaeota archaeon]|nr:hypothetical protein [Candidatus Micrarchaeota archaeon]
MITIIVLITMEKNATIKRLEKGPLDRLTNENLLIKRFGTEGLFVYTAIDNVKTVEEILDETGVSEDKFSEILDFMIEHNMIDIIGSGEEAGEITEPEFQPSESMEPSEEEVTTEQVPTPPSTVIQPEQKTTTIIQKEEEVEQAEQIKPHFEEQKTVQPPSVQKPETPQIPSVPHEETKESLPSEEANIPKPPEVKKEQPEEQAEEPVQEKEELITPLPEEKGSVSTPSPPTTHPATVAKPPPSPSKPVSEVSKEQKAPPVSTGNVEIKPSLLSEEEEDKFAKQLTPIERKIYDKFGKMGVRVYSLIDGEKTAEEILKTTGISDVQLIEILEFLDTEGIIKLEKPEKRKSMVEMKPITEKQASPPKELKPSGEAEEIIGSDIIPIDIPVKKPLPIMKKVLLFPKLLTVDNGKLKKVYDMINGNRSIIDLCLLSNSTLPAMDKYMELLANEGAVMFKTMSRDDILNKYGDEGLSIYKKYGREGIIIYELIGEVSSFKEIVTRSGIQPDRAVDIFIFIHKVLNLELPITKETMYKQLGIQ